MADFKSSFSGPQIDDAVQKALTVDPRGNGWIKLDSSSDNPLSMNTIKNAGNYMALYVTGGPPDLTGVVPINFSIGYKDGKLIQTINIGDDMYYRGFDDVTKEWLATWEVARSSTSISMSEDSSTPPTNPEENAIWIHKGANNTYTMKIYKNGAWHDVGQDGLMSSLIYDPTNQRSDLYALIDQKFVDLTADKTEILAHIANADIHTTAAEKTTWSQKVTKTEFETAKTALQTSLETKIDTDTTSAGTTATQTLEKITALTTTMNTHMADATKHVTPEQVAGWEGKAAGNHEHKSDGKVEIDASKVVSGIIDIARIPSAAIEDVTEVADKAAMLALTKTQVQNGDTVFVKDTKNFYYVIDDTKLNLEASYKLYSTGVAESITWENVRNRPTTISGYGITDAYTKTEVDTQIAAQAEIFNAELNDFSRNRSRTLFLKKQIPFRTGLRGMYQFGNTTGLKYPLSGYKTDMIAPYTINHDGVLNDRVQYSPYVCIPVYDADVPSLLYVGEPKNSQVIRNHVIELTPNQLNGLTGYTPTLVSKVRKVARFSKWTGSGDFPTKEILLIGYDLDGDFTGRPASMGFQIATHDAKAYNADFDTVPIKTNFDVFGNPTLMNHDIVIHTSGSANNYTFTSARFLSDVYNPSTSKVYVLDFEIDDSTGNVLVLVESILENSAGANIDVLVCKMKFAAASAPDTILADNAYTNDAILRYLDPLYGIRVKDGGTWGTASEDHPFEFSIKRLGAGMFVIHCATPTTESNDYIKDTNVRILHTVTVGNQTTYELRTFQSITGGDMIANPTAGWVTDYSFPRTQYLSYVDALFLMGTGSVCQVVYDLKKKLNMDGHIQSPTNWSVPLFRNDPIYNTADDTKNDVGFIKFFEPTEYYIPAENASSLTFDNQVVYMPLEITAYLNNLHNKSDIKFSEILDNNGDLFFAFSPDFSIFGVYRISKVEGKLNIERMNQNVTKYPLITDWTYFKHSLFSWDFNYGVSNGSKWEQSTLGNTTFDIYQLTEQGFNVWECAEIGAANRGISSQVEELTKKIESMTIPTGSIWAERGNLVDLIIAETKDDLVPETSVTIIDFIPGPQPYTYHLYLAKSAKDFYYLGYITQDGSVFQGKIPTACLPNNTKPVRLCNAVVGNYTGTIPFTGCGVLIALMTEADGVIADVASNQIGHLYINSILDFVNKRGNISSESFSAHCRTKPTGTIIPIGTRIEMISLSPVFGSTNKLEIAMTFSNTTQRYVYRHIVSTFTENGELTLSSKALNLGVASVGDDCSIVNFYIDTDGALIKEVTMLSSSGAASLIGLGSDKICDPSEVASFRDNFSTTSFVLHSTYNHAVLVSDTDVYIKSLFAVNLVSPLYKFPHNLVFGSGLLFLGFWVIPNGDQFPTIMIFAEDKGSTEGVIYSNTSSDPGNFVEVYRHRSPFTTLDKDTSYAFHIAFQKNCGMSEYNDLMVLAGGVNADPLGCMLNCYTNINPENPNITAKMIADAFKYRNKAQMLAIQSQGIYKSTCDAIDDIKKCVSLL